MNRELVGMLAWRMDPVGLFRKGKFRRGGKKRIEYKI